MARPENLKFKFIDSPDLKSQICDSVLRQLPKWFGIESAIVDYVNDVKEMPTWAAYYDDELAGFLSVNHPFQYSSEIHVMGVLAKFHRKKIGHKLLLVAEDYLKLNSVRFLQVKTLSPRREDENYKKTRLFYTSMGFVPLEEFKTLWGEHNPCLQLIKSL